MSVQRNISRARAYLNDGNAYGYAAVMSGYIRSSLSNRSLQKYRDAVSNDGMVHAFDDWGTSVPQAKRGVI